METVTNETATRLRYAITRLNRRLRQSALGGVSPAQASLLAVVSRLKRPSLGDLAAAEQISPPSVTRLVRDMERLGLIERVADDVDRRCTRVTITASGRHELAAIRRRKDEFLERALDALPEAERRRAGELATLLETILEQS